MRKVLLSLLVFISCTAAAVYAADENHETKLSIWGGYATYSLSDVNDLLDRVGSAVPGSSVTKPQSGFAITGEAMWKVSPKWLVGPRIEYLTVNQGKVTYPLGLGENTIDQSALPVYLGTRYIIKPMQYDSRNFNDKWALSAGLYAGYGWSWAKTSVKTSGLLGSIDSSVNYSASGFSSAVLLGWAYQLSKNVELGIDLGYRYMPMGELKATEDNTTLAVKKNDVLAAAGKTVKPDFSGLLANVGLLFRM